MATKLEVTLQVTRLFPILKFNYKFNYMDAKLILESMVKYLNSEGYETVIIIASKIQDEKNVTDHVFLCGTVQNINNCLLQTQSQLINVAKEQIKKQTL